MPTRPQFPNICAVPGGLLAVQTGWQLPYLQQWLQEQGRQLRALCELQRLCAVPDGLRALWRLPQVCPRRLQLPRVLGSIQGRAQEVHQGGWRCLAPAARPAASAACCYRRWCECAAGSLSHAGIGSAVKQGSCWKGRRPMATASVSVTPPNPWQPGQLRLPPLVPCCVRRLQCLDPLCEACSTPTKCDVCITSSEDGAAIFSNSKTGECEKVRQRLGAARYGCTAGSRQQPYL